MALRLILSLAVAMGAACSTAEPDLAESSQDIIGGFRIPGQYMGVVFVIARDSAGKAVFYCTGELITPRVVMTAAHCANGANGAKRYDVHFCDKYDTQTKEFIGEVDDVPRTSQAVWVHPDFEEGQLTSGNDVALYYLDKPAPESVAPFAINRYRLTAAQVNLAIKFVGFGLQLPGSNILGEKLAGIGKVATVNPKYITHSGAISTCQGDSGGPTFITLNGQELVAGVTSFGTGGTCGTGSTSALTRVDVNVDLIDAFIAAHDPQAKASCGADGVCGTACDAVDPDCPCWGDGFCTTACTTPDLDPDCPLDCLQNGACVRQGCAAPDPDCGNKPVGAGCANNNECGSGFCVPEGSDHVCAASCATAACDEGFTCSAAKVCLSDGGGGGCEVGRGAGGGSWGGALALLLLSAGWWMRGRRSTRA